MSSLVTKIGKQVNQMTKSQKKVANYLLFNMDKLLFFTADELAKAANVSTATVVRFARELDFEGYTDMQKAARLRFHDREEEPEDLPQSSPEEDSSEYLLEKSFRQDIQNLKRTFQDLFPGGPGTGLHPTEDLQAGLSRGHAHFPLHGHICLYQLGDAAEGRPSDSQ